MSPSSCSSGQSIYRIIVEVPDPDGSQTTTRSAVWLFRLTLTSPWNYSNNFKACLRDKIAPLKFTAIIILFSFSQTVSINKRYDELSTRTNSVINMLLIDTWDRFPCLIFWLKLIRQQFVLDPDGYGIPVVVYHTSNNRIFIERFLPIRYLAGKSNLFIERVNNIFQHE